MPTLITLIRHGETHWNAIGRWQGHAHVPLNDEGRRQAKLLASYFAEKAREISTIYSSDSLRALDTARVIAARMDKLLVADARLREIDMGEWQGLTGDEIRTWDTLRYHAIMSDGYTRPRPGGESGQQVAARVSGFLEEIAIQHRNEHVLAVTHGGAIVNALRGLQLLGEKHETIRNTSFTRLSHEPSNGNAVQSGQVAQSAWKLDAFNMLL